VADDLRPAIQSALDAFGLPAVVTPPGGPSVETTAVWLPPVTVDHPIGQDLQRAEPKRVLALPYTPGVTSIPRGTVVVVPEMKDAAPASWKVDEVDRVNPDEWRMTVLPA